jgi:capsular exopolysaccharide synthesis family protein
MGRIYDALKRAEGEQRQNGKPVNLPLRHKSNPDNITYLVPKNGYDHPWETSPFTGIPVAENLSSAPTAHTADAAGGPALPGGNASRDAGATLGAVGSARAVEFTSLDVSAARVEPHLIAITQPRSPECEQFRALRTRLLHAGERQKTRVFVITSAGMGEGKTLTALNLGWLLSQTDGVTALVIDADLRQPCAAGYFGIETTNGLSEVLTGEVSLAQSIIKLEPAGMHLLPGGQARDDVAELLSGPRFARLIEQARKMFDYIIIDAPPLGIFTDANLLINRADAALLVVRAGKTRYAVVDRLLEQLPRERMFGVVLNFAEAVDATSYYYQRQDRPEVVAPEAAIAQEAQTEFNDEPQMIIIAEESVV